MKEARNSKTKAPPPLRRGVGSTAEIYTDPDTGRCYTWAQVRSASVAFGRGLRAAWGFGRGDALGFYSPNSVDYPAALFGALWAGGAATTANPAYTAAELAFQLRDSGARGLVTQLSLAPVALQAARDAGIPADRVILIGDARDPEGRLRHFTEIRAGDAGGADEARTKVDPRRDPAFIVYSSGTTGLPKGVPLTHYNIVANLEQLRYIDTLNGLTPFGGVDGKGDKQLAILPFFHVYVSRTPSLRFPFSIPSPYLPQYL